MYRVNGNNLKWFHSYLSNWKQFVWLVKLNVRNRCVCMAYCKLTDESSAGLLRIDLNLQTNHSLLEL